MRIVETEPVVTLYPAAGVDHGDFSCFRETDFAGRFHFWRGASNRRYTVSVMTLEPTLDPFCVAETLPEFDGFVLISVARSKAMRWPIAIAAIERNVDRRSALMDAQAMGASEWHVHLLAVDRSARASVVADLRARHLNERYALSA